MGLPLVSVFKNSDISGASPESALCTRKEVCKQILHAVSALHSQGVAHRDLCIDNIFISGVSPESASDVWVRLADLGSASLLVRTARRPIDFGCRPTGHQAPEILMDGIWDEKMDVWSCGVLTAFIFMGKLPWLASGGALYTIRCILKSIGAPPRDAIPLVESFPGWQPSWAVGVPCVWHEDLRQGLGPYLHLAEAMLAWAPSRQEEKLIIFVCVVVVMFLYSDCRVVVAVAGAVAVAVEVVAALIPRHGLTM